MRGNVASLRVPPANSLRPLAAAIRVPRWLPRSGSTAATRRPKFPCWRRCFLIQ